MLIYSYRIKVCSIRFSDVNHFTKFFDAFQLAKSLAGALSTEGSPQVSGGLKCGKMGDNIVAANL
jgi:hypothetical protein